MTGYLDSITPPACLFEKNMLLSHTMNNVLVRIVLVATTVLLPCSCIHDEPTDAEDKWVVANYKETQTANIAVAVR